jgi:predicted XRE-type DNA-binding protein
MTKNKFPKEETLKKMRDKLQAVEGSYILQPDASAGDKVKYEICRNFIMFMHKKGLTQRELAGIVSIPETRISEIVHYRIAKFTIDKLLSYYEKLNPKVMLKVA